MCLFTIIQYLCYEFIQFVTSPTVQLSGMPINPKMSVTQLSYFFAILTFTKVTYIYFGNPVIKTIKDSQVKKLNYCNQK